MIEMKVENITKAVKGVGGGGGGHRLTFTHSLQTWHNMAPSLKSIFLQTHISKVWMRSSQRGQSLEESLLDSGCWP